MNLCGEGGLYWHLSEEDVEGDGDLRLSSFKERCSSEVSLTAERLREVISFSRNSAGAGFEK